MRREVCLTVPSRDMSTEKDGVRKNRQVNRQAERQQKKRRRVQNNRGEAMVVCSSSSANYINFYMWATARHALYQKVLFPFHCNSFPVDAFSL
jgi:hypothetical protein